MVAINPAVLQHLQLPGEFLYLWDRQHQLTLLLLEQAVHLFNLLHWRGRESTIAALRNGPAWAASKAARRGHGAAGCCKPVAPGKTALSWGSWTSKLGSKAMESLSAQSTQAESLNSHNARIPQWDAHSYKANIYMMLKTPEFTSEEWQMTMAKHSICYTEQSLFRVYYTLSSTAVLIIQNRSILERNLKNGELFKQVPWSDLLGVVQGSRYTCCVVSAPIPLCYFAVFLFL